MRQSFDAALKFVLAKEGGYSNDPNDPGGETKFGICKKSHPEEDIANMTPERAGEIYLEEYWIPAGCDDIEVPDDIVVFDCAVNQGVAFAKEMVHECGTDQIAMLFYRLKKYSGIVKARPKSLPYLRGWVNREIELYDYIKEVKP